MPLDPKGGSVGLGGVKPELEGSTCTLSVALFKYIFWPGDFSMSQIQNGVLNLLLIETYILQRPTNPGLPFLTHPNINLGQ